MKTYCMPDEVKTKKDHIQYLSDIGGITWEFESWIEQDNREAHLNGIDDNGNKFTALGIMSSDQLSEIIEVKNIEQLNL